jgi:tetratricopeptide (TPR) repeat protein
MILLLSLFCLTSIFTGAQTSQPSPPPTPQRRRPLPKLPSGARGFDFKKEKDSSVRLIAVGGGWGAEEDKRKPRLREKSARGYYKLGSLYLERLEFAKAITPLEKAVNLNPNYLAAYGSLGEAYAYAGVSAETDIDENPGDRERKAAAAKAEDIRNKRYLQAIQAFEQARRLAPQNPNFHFNLAVLYFNTEQYQKAADSFQQGMRLSPRKGEIEVPILESARTPSSLYVLLGAAYENLAQNENALKAYEQALQVSPQKEKADIYLTVGDLHRKLGETEKALTAYENSFASSETKQLERRSDYGEALLTLGSLYVAKDRYVEAADAFSKAILVFEKEFNRYKQWLAEADEEGRKSLQEAVATQQAGLIHAFYNLGVAELSLGQAERAVDSFNRVVELDATNADGRFNLGFAYLRLGNKEAARQQARELEAIDSELAKELLDLIGKY